MGKRLSSDCSSNAGGDIPKASDQAIKDSKFDIDNREHTDAVKKVALAPTISLGTPGARKTTRPSWGLPIGE